MNTRKTKTPMRKYIIASYTVAGSGSSVSAASMWPFFFFIIILVVVVAYVYRRRLMPLANKGLRVVRKRKVPNE